MRKLLILCFILLTLSCSGWEVKPYFKNETRVDERYHYIVGIEATPKE